VWSQCWQAEVSLVTGSDVGRTAPPPMVANMLHCINPLLSELVTIATESHLDVARQRPSWIRGVVVDTADATIAAQR
jgi:hypothetical protein